MPTSEVPWQYDLRAYKAIVSGNRSELVFRMAGLNVTGALAIWLFDDRVFLYMLVAYNVTQLGFIWAVYAQPNIVSRLRAFAIFAGAASIMVQILFAAVYLWIDKDVEGKILSLLLITACMLYSTSLRIYEPVISRIEVSLVSVACLILAGYSVLALDMTGPALSMVIGLLSVLVYYIMAALSAMRTHERLTQSQAAEVSRARMQAMGQLASGVAHDFNNLLTIIKGNLELRRVIQLQGGSLLEAEQLIREAEDATERAERTAQHLLAFGRRADVVQMRVRLEDVLQETLPLLKASLPANIALDIVVSEETAPIRCDLATLENVLLNLVINARDAMPNGGMIRLSAVGTERDATLEVRDTGQGIPPDVLERVQEPFFSTKPSGRGTGLGLSMARAFMDQAGGSLTIHSALGEGTLVRLKFPAAASEEIERALPPVA